VVGVAVPTCRHHVERGEHRSGRGDDLGRYRLRPSDVERSDSTSRRSRFPLLGLPQHEDHLVCPGTVWGCSRRHLLHRGDRPRPPTRTRSIMITTGPGAARRQGSGGENSRPPSAGIARRTARPSNGSARTRGGRRSPSAFRHSKPCHQSAAAAATAAAGLVRHDEQPHGIIPGKITVNAAPPLSLPRCHSASVVVDNPIHDCQAEPGALPRVGEERIEDAARPGPPARPPAVADAPPAPR